MPGWRAAKAIGQARGGSEAPDVLVPGLFWIEAKVGQAPPLMRALNQAVGDCPPGEGLTPMAIVKQDRHDPVALIRLDDLLELLGEWWESRQ